MIARWRCRNRGKFTHHRCFGNTTAGRFMHWAVGSSCFILCGSGRPA